MSNPVVIHASKDLVDSVRNEVTNAQSRLNNLIGDDASKTARMIAKEEVAKVLDDVPTKVRGIVSSAISVVEVPPDHADYDTLFLCVQQLVRQLKGLSE